MALVDGAADPPWAVDVEPGGCATGFADPEELAEPDGALAGGDAAVAGALDPWDAAGALDPWDAAGALDPWDAAGALDP